MNVEKQTVIYIISTLKNLGPVNQLYYLVENLDRQKFQPVIITLSKEPADSKISEFKELDVEIHQINLSRIKGLFFLTAAVKKIISKYKKIIIHSHGLRPDYINSQLKGYISFTTIHNFPYDDYLMKYGKFKGRIISFIHLAIIKKIKNKIACSEAISNLFQSKLNIKLDYINNGVNTDFYLPAREDEKIELRKKYNISITKEIIVYTGQIIKRKDLVTAINGFKKYNNGNSVFLIVGDGKAMDEISLLKDDSVMFVGKTANVLDYLKIADQFLSASLSEGLPNSVLEAMSCDVKSVLSDIQAHMCLKNSGVTFFKTGDSDALSLALEENRKKTNANNRQFIIEKYSVSMMVNNYQQKYLKAVAGCNE